MKAADGSISPVFLSGFKVRFRPRTMSLREHFDVHLLVWKTPTRALLSSHSELGSTGSSATDRPATSSES